MKLPRPVDIKNLLRPEPLRRIWDETRIRFNLHHSTEFLILSESHRIPQAMVNPLVRWKGQSDTKAVIEVTRERASKYMLWDKVSPSVVFVQCWFNTSRREVEDLILGLRTNHPHAKIVFLDWYAPTHLPQPWLFDLVDVYIKKHLMRDKSTYRDGFCDTNLIEYEAQWDVSFKPPRANGISDSHIDSKLVLGWNFATDRFLSSQIRNGPFPSRERPINLHCRIAVENGEPWYRHMRKRAFDAVSELGVANVIVSDQLIPSSMYWDELRKSKACVSPFGYGEVCWRDFEAIAAGAVLIKPDMGHLETQPDIYQPYETYVPVRWDWKDLAEKVHWVLESEERRSKIVVRAADVWSQFIKTGWQAERSRLIRLIGR
ncbi:MAG: glycosyltransferase [Pseudomonadaceae bacterium]|nr:glycosyltransferase [Pseudomonadaceae bacterium]